MASVDQRQYYKSICPFNFHLLWVHQTAGNRAYNNCLSDTCRALAAATAIAAVRLPAKLSFSSGPLLYHDDANQQVRGGASDSKGSKRPSNKIHSQHDISYHIQR